MALLPCTPGAAKRLTAALTHARAGRLASARAAARAVLGDAPHDAVSHVGVAGVLYVTRDYDEGLSALGRAARLDPRLFRRTVDDHFRYAGSLGWDQEVREVLERAMERQPSEPRWPVLAMRLFARADAPGRALEMARRALALTPRSARLTMEVAHLLVENGRSEQAVEAVTRALELAPASDLRAFREAAAHALTDAGAFDRAEQMFCELLAADPSRVALHHALAELALARGDTAAARTHTRAADEWIERADRRSTAVSERIRGAAAMLEARLDEAAALFDHALSLDADDHVALVWRAEVAMHRRDTDTAHALLSRATMRAPAYFVAPRLIRFLVVAREEGGEDAAPHRTGEFADAVCEMVPEATDAFRRRDLPGIVAAASEALRRMRGNRTVRTTYLDAAGQLRRLRTRGGVRHDSRRALQLIRTFPPDETLRALDEVCARYPDASLPICHRGELHLWLGDLDAARRDLYGAIERHRWTRWAYIGLSGVELMRGRPGNAIAANARGVEVMGGTVGPAVYAYRGEAYRLLGDHSRARADLEKAIELTPTRVAAWVNLALLHDARGDDAGFVRAWAHLERAASGLLSCAAAEVDVVLFRDPGDPPARAEQRAVLERCLVMMRGNRSTSCATFFTADGHLRFVQPLSAAGVSPHARDADILDRVERLARTGVGVTASDAERAGES